MVDDLAWNEEAAGSIPATLTKFNALVGQLVESAGLEPVKCQFESDQGYHMLLKPLLDEVLPCKQEKSVRFRTGAPEQCGGAREAQGN